MACPPPSRLKAPAAGAPPRPLLPRYVVQTPVKSGRPSSVRGISCAVAAPAPAALRADAWSCAAATPSHITEPTAASVAYAFILVLVTTPSPFVIPGRDGFDASFAPGRARLPAKSRGYIVAQLPCGHHGAGERLRALGDASERDGS